MKRACALVFLGCIIVSGAFLIQCGLNEPMLSSGSIRIVFSTGCDTGSMAKALEMIGSVHCTLMRGSIVYYDQDLIRVGNVFEGRIDALPPGDDYALSLYGRKTQGADNIIAIAARTGIEVRVASQTEVVLEWHSFMTHLFSPDNGAIIHISRPLLCWSKVEIATFYRLKIDDDSNFLSPLVTMDCITDTQWVLFEPLKNGLYYWKVSSTDTSGNTGPWSDVWTFTLFAGTPLPPEPVSPQDGETIEGSQPVFIWNAARGASAYCLQVSAEDSFIDPVVEEIHLTGMEFRGAPMLANGSYFWRMASMDSLSNTGDWSAAIPFFVSVPVPDAPHLQSPEDGSLVADSSLTLTWEAVQGALEYRLQVDTAGTWNPPLLDRDRLQSAEFLYTPPEDTRYFWRVAAKDEAGNLAWSDFWSFIKSTQPVLPKGKEGP